MSAPKLNVSGSYTGEPSRAVLWPPNPQPLNGLSPSLGKGMCFHKVLEEWVLGLERWLSS